MQMTLRCKRHSNRLLLGGEVEVRVAQGMGRIRAGRAGMGRGRRNEW